MLQCELCLLKSRRLPLSVSKFCHVQVQELCRNSYRMPSWIIKMQFLIQPLNVLIFSTPWSEFKLQNTRGTEIGRDAIKKLKLAWSLETINYSSIDFMNARNAHTYIGNRGLHTHIIWSNHHYLRITHK